MPKIPDKILEMDLVQLNQKCVITPAEAAALTSIGEATVFELVTTDERFRTCTLAVGRKTLIKRNAFMEQLLAQEKI